MFEDELEAFSDQARAGMTQLIEAFGHEVARSDHKLAIDILLYFLNIIFLEKALFPGITPGADLPINGEALAAEAAEMAYGYLSTPDPD